MDAPKVTTPPDYYHRRADDLLDQRLGAFEREQDRQGKALSRLEARINYLFGALAVLTTLASIIGPWLEKMVAP